MIAGAGFVEMAWELACRQANQPAIMAPLDRAICEGWGYWSPSANYYRILGSAQTGFDVIQAERSRGLNIAQGVWYL